MEKFECSSIEKDGYGNQFCAGSVLYFGCNLFYIAFFIIAYNKAIGNKYLVHVQISSLAYYPNTMDADLDKIFHVHYKDIKVYPDKLNQVGIMAYPLEFMSPKLPGLGDVDWGKYVSALTDIGYDGYTCIEVEDKAFEGTKVKVLDSLKLRKKYMEQFVI